MSLGIEVDSNDFGSNLVVSKFSPVESSVESPAESPVEGNNEGEMC